MPSFIQGNITLAPHTTIKLGGPARFFATCQSVDEAREALQFASQKHLPIYVLAGGSNTVFADEGFPGLVIKIDLRGVTFDGESVRASAGEVWDELVQESIARDLAGFECLSGIPGSVGATPMQNVGAYGQEVSQTITRVTAIDRRTLADVEFTAADCRFGYRTSRFKTADRDRYIVTDVTYQLRHRGEPTLTYSQVADAITTEELTGTSPGRQQLTIVRDAVLNLRRAKSMVIDPNDPNTHSCGSFFVNPALDTDALAILEQCWRAAGGTTDVPTFIDSSTGEPRVPAAWLIEQAGFPKGFRQGGVGISSNHNLALVNYGGTTAELVTLKDAIQAAVKEKFGINLVPEPVIVAQK